MYPPQDPLVAFVRAPSFAPLRGSVPRGAHKRLRAVVHEIAHKQTPGFGFEMGKSSDTVSGTREGHGTVIINGEAARASCSRNRPVNEGSVPEWRQGL